MRLDLPVDKYTIEPVPINDALLSQAGDISAHDYDEAQTRIAP